MMTSYPKYINVGGELMDLSRPRVMGILNVTPDSFYAGSRMQSEQEIAARVEQILAEGGEMIDIGAYSSRPGADDVSTAEEMERLRRGLSIVRRMAPQAVVSVDTFRADVVQAMKGEKAMTEEQVRAIVREELAAQEARRAAEPADDWAKPYIETAIQAGILDGVEDGQGGITIARPKPNPTREEMATMGVALLRSNRS